MQKNLVRIRKDVAHEAGFPLNIVRLVGRSISLALGQPRLVAEVTQEGHDVDANTRACARKCGDGALPVELPLERGADDDCDHGDADECHQQQRDVGFPRRFDSAKRQDGQHAEHEPHEAQAKGHHVTKHSILL